ncbi:hypothetical protein LTR15_000179 [Elasticomyces elasticus]|nr:hypothetical protein LTR15_000179 [Elasticomyces elasticus]
MVEAGLELRDDSGALDPDPKDESDCSELESDDEGSDDEYDPNLRPAVSNISRTSKRKRESSAEAESRQRGPGPRRPNKRHSESYDVESASEGGPDVDDVGRHRRASGLSSTLTIRDRTPAAVVPEKDSSLYNEPQAVHASTLAARAHRHLAADSPEGSGDGSNSVHDGRHARQANTATSDASNHQLDHDRRKSAAPRVTTGKGHAGQADAGAEESRSRNSNDQSEPSKPAATSQHQRPSNPPIDLTADSDGEQTMQDKKADLAMRKARLRVKQGAQKLREEEQAIFEADRALDMEERKLAKEKQRQAGADREEAMRFERELKVESAE